MSAADFELFFSGLAFAPAIFPSVRGADTVADNLDGTDKADAMYGLGLDDIIAGNAGNDLIFGGPGNDTLHASAIPGSPNAPDVSNRFFSWNILEGGPGNDTMHGGPADDFFYFGFDSGADIINGFNPQTDAIAILQGINNNTSVTLGSEAQFFASRVTDVPFGVVVDFGNGNTVRVVNVTKAQLSPANFPISPV